MDAESVEDHIGCVLGRIIHRMLWKGSGTITKCLMLGHFRCFPQVDVRFVKWHFGFPHRARGDGAIQKDSLCGSLLGQSQQEVKFRL